MVFVIALIPNQPWQAEALREAERLKACFFADISHEFRVS